MRQRLHVTAACRLTETEELELHTQYGGHASSVLNRASFLQELHGAEACPAPHPVPQGVWRARAHSLGHG